MKLPELFDYSKHSKVVLSNSGFNEPLAFSRSTSTEATLRGIKNSVEAASRAFEDQEDEGRESDSDAGGDSAAATEILKLTCSGSNGLSAEGWDKSTRVALQAAVGSAYASSDVG